MLMSAAKSTDGMARSTAADATAADGVDQGTSGTSLTLLDQLSGGSGGGEEDDTAVRREREVAWADFDRIYRPRIAGFARRAGAIGSEVDEVTQDVIASFYRVNHTGTFRYDEAGSLRGYLFRSACNALIDLRRRESRPGRGRSGGDLVSRLDAAGLLADERDAQAVWDKVWGVDQLRQAMETVRATYRDNKRADERTFTAFEQTSLQERSAAEVGNELDMSEESVRSAKRHVKKAVMKEVARLRELED